MANKATQLHIRPFQPGDQIHIRCILNSIGWDEHYIVAFKQAAMHLSQGGNSAVFVVDLQALTIGFVFVEHHEWNRLAQTQGLAVDAAYQRIRAASALVARAEEYARACRARGIYVDIPTTNDGGRRFYEAIGYQVGYIQIGSQASGHPSQSADCQSCCNHTPE